MSQPARPGDLVTPEAVSLTPDIAGLGSRMIATIIDIAIQSAVVIGLTILFFQIASAPDGVAALVIYLILVFLLTWGYYPLFEGFWNGRTPGKRLQRIRVVRSDGQPVTVGPVLVRNLVRVVDFLPSSYGVGVVSMMLTRRSQRLGDLAAGTIVIRERPLPPPAPLALGPDVAADAALDTTGLSEREYALVRSFLERRASLTPAARRQLATELAKGLRPRVGADKLSSEDHERFLEGILRSYRRRFTDAPISQEARPPPIPPPP
jgi:uncharacterized RDD family membrane protein YckC